MGGSDGRRLLQLSSVPVRAFTGGREITCGGSEGMHLQYICLQQYIKDLPTYTFPLNKDLDVFIVVFGPGKPRQFSPIHVFNSTTLRLGTAL